MADEEKIKQQYLSDKHADYHKSQFIEPKRSTVALKRFLQQMVPDSEMQYEAIDVGCGAGANIYHLSNVLPHTKWTGLDFAGDFFTYAGPFLSDPAKYKLVKGDFLNLSATFPPKSFDIAFSIQTLSWLPRYETALTEILAVTRGWIFVTSLFSEFNVDVFSNVFEYDDRGNQREDSPYNYNVYSLNRFKNFCLSLGAREVIAEEFVMDIDLPVPEHRQMATYTVKDATQKRLQFSGPLFLPWKMVAIRL